MASTPTGSPTDTPKSSAGKVASRAARSDGLRPLKEYEVKRQRAFRKWLESAKTSMVAERERAASAKRLVAIVRQQVKDRTEADGMFAQKLQESARSRGKSITAQLAKVPAWLMADVQEAHYLTALQEQCGKMLEDAAKAAHAALEGNQSLQRLEQQLGSPSSLLEDAEQQLHTVQGLDAECSQAFAKLEAAVKRRPTTPGGSDLWEHDIAYRSAVMHFDMRIRSCEVAVRQLRDDAVTATLEHRQATRKMLRDVIDCFIFSLSSVMKTMTLPSDKRMLPTVPSWQVSAVPAGKEAPRGVATEMLPTLVSWIGLPRMPSSQFCTLSSCVQRPPKLLSLTSAWRSAHLVLSSDGRVHCFESDPDKPESVQQDGTAAKAVCVLQPSPGCSRVADPSARTLSLSRTDSGWLRKDSAFVVRFVSDADFAAWQVALKQWWPLQDGSSAPTAGEPEAAAAAAAAAAVAAADARGVTSPPRVATPDTSPKASASRKEEQHETTTSLPAAPAPPPPPS
eukprot:CAMPEP_0178390770 /NCGR_PEP_ID=MMETSP0689_2-20121128/10817_1 /TAXON_ID=160604 /ORGANISM="Amphidinium massartii, Strain CS-259" /LENGTH=509 /DNA_ID=CAMNT_0020011289 /DNA_START=12 /DNA_END=1537 /DNA_ORIENTATION=+